MEANKKKVNTPKKQKVSATYTITAFGNNIKKLVDLQLISKESLNELVKVQKEIIDNYVRNLMK